MNLAEQIKNQIRQENPIDYDGLTKMLKDFYAQNGPTNCNIRVNRRINSLQSDMFGAEIPFKWAIDVEQWANDNGFVCKREFSNIDPTYLTGFLVRLF